MPTAELTVAQSELHSAPSTADTLQVQGMACCWMFCILMMCLSWLHLQVQRPVPAQVDDQTMTPNFKRFRKLQPSLAAHNTVAFCPKGYAESNIDSEAFLK